jgi:hypothetical protein
VIEGTGARYREAYERITGEAFDDYLSRAGVTPRHDDKAPDDKAPDDDAALERLREGRA